MLSVLRGPEAPLFHESTSILSTTYQIAVSRMMALGHELAQTPAQKFDLDHMRVLLTALDHPERRFPSVLIAGTNGKGSTAATLESILRVSGVRTGLYTSPHLVTMNERIRMGGEKIGDADFAELHTKVDAAARGLVEKGELPWHPSFFEMMTAIAFEHFAREKVEIAVLEVGMGGRLDATNVVDPRVSVITDVALDHQKYLGNTVGEIAREKAGIIRSGGVVVTLPQSPEANDVIGNAILDSGARGVNAVPYVPPVSPGAGSLVGREDAKKIFSCYPLAVLGAEILVETPLVGRHQLRNVALAVATAVELKEQGFSGITASSVEAGIRSTRWPGRFQYVAARAEWPDIVIDVAHNPAGAWALRSALSERFLSGQALSGLSISGLGEDRRLIFVFGAMQDKAISEMTEILFPLAERVIATQPQNPRAASPEEIQLAAARTGAEIEAVADVAQALERARELALDGGLLVIAGSIYLAGEAMRILGIEI